MIKTAEISPCGKYRYYLSRRWQEGKPTATFIMLNPSTADAEQDDPTIRRCIGFAKAWNCGRLQVINLFALRATSPVEIKLSSDPVGPDNHDWFQRAYQDASYPDDKGPIVCAWGVHGGHIGQDETAMGWIFRLPAWEKDTWCFGYTKELFPRHPLYVRLDTPLVRYHGRPSNQQSI